MGRFARIFVPVGVCLVSVTSWGYTHSDEELAKINKDADDIQRTLDGFSKNLSGELASKYKVLRNALEAYATGHGDNESNAPGTGWADAVAAYKEAVLKEFIELFKKLDSQQLKAISELEFEQKDVELNRVYQALLKNKNLDSEVAAQASRRGIKDTQRNWIKYRDAWLAFAVLKFPTVSTHSLNATLTASRISALRRITRQVNEF